MATIPLPSRRSRLAVATIFFVNGAVLASWVAHIPGVKERHGIGDGSLGFVLLFMALGAVLALPLGGWLVDRFGSRLITSLAALVFCLALPWPLLSRDVTCLVTALVLLGACNAVLDAFLGMLAEGAMGDWSAVYLHDALGQSGAAAATGFAAFSLAMAVGRLGGDRLADGLGPRALLRASGAVAAAGLGVALIAGEPRVALAGFAAVGLGIANIIPVTFRPAGPAGDVPAGTALAA